MAALTTPQFAVVSGGIACVIGVGVVARRFPELASHTIRRTGGGRTRRLGRIGTWASRRGRSTAASRGRRRWRVRRPARGAQPRHRSRGPPDPRRPAQLPPLPADALPGRDRCAVARRHRPAAPLAAPQAAQHDGHPRRGGRPRSASAARSCWPTAGRSPYDTLVVATGAHHTYFDHPEWAAIAPGLKTIEDATEIRRRILIAFEAAEREADPERRRAWMTFVVVGGGPTGRRAGGRARRDRARHAQARLPVDPSRGGADHPGRGDGPDPAAVPAGPVARRRSGSSSAWASRSGRGRGSSTSTRTACASPARTGARRDPGARPSCWAAGVLASSFGRAVAEATGAPTDRAGRVIVEPDLTIPGHPEIFVVGDAAVQPWKPEKATPGVAQGAMQGGSYAAAVIRRRILGRPYEPFRYSDHGDVGGHRAAVGRHQHRLARAVRAPGRVHGLGALARHPPLLPDRLLEPDRRAHPLGVDLPDPRPRDAADHRNDAPAADRGARAAGPRARWSPRRRRRASDGVRSPDQTGRRLRPVGKNAAASSTAATRARTRMTKIRSWRRWIAARSGGT